jgi:hypothetical protein
LGAQYESSIVSSGKFCSSKAKLIVDPPYKGVNKTQKYNLQKHPLKETKILQDIITSR